MALRRKQVKVLVNTRVQELRKGVLVTSAGEVSADLIVWAAGIKAADTNAQLGMEVNRINQFVVDSHLRTSVPKSTRWRLRRSAGKRARPCLRAPRPLTSRPPIWPRCLASAARA